MIATDQPDVLRLVSSLPCWPYRLCTSKPMSSWRHKLQMLWEATKCGTKMSSRPASGQVPSALCWLLTMLLLMPSAQSEYQTQQQIAVSSPCNRDLLSVRALWQLTVSPELLQSDHHSLHTSKLPAWASLWQRNPATLSKIHGDQGEASGTSLPSLQQPQQTHTWLCCNAGLPH